MNVRKVKPQIILLILLQVVVFLTWGGQKDIWFGDEVLTFESANYDLTEGLYEFEANGGAGIWISGDEFQNRWSVMDGLLHFDTIKRDLFDDHVPLYFYLVHVASLVAKGSCSKWIPLSLNLIFYLILGVALLTLLQKKGKGIAPLLMTMVVLLHPVVITMLTFARMYLMFTAVLSLLLILFNEQALGSWKKSLLLGLLIAVGLLTHYYFWVYGALFAAVLFGSLLAKKKWMQIVRMIVAAVEAGAVTTIVYPQWIYRLTAGNGATALGKAFNVGSLITEMKDTAVVMGDLVAPGFGILALALMVGLLVAYVIRDKGETKQVYLTLIASVLYVFFVVHTTPNGQVERYVWPAVAVLMGVMAYQMQEVFSDKRAVLTGFAAIMLLGSLVAGFDDKNVDYLTIRTEDELQALYDRSDAPWIIVGEEDEWRMTCISYDFRIPEQIMLWNEEVPARDDEILKSASEVVLYVPAEADYEDVLNWVMACRGEEAKDVNPKVTRISCNYNTEVYSLLFDF